MMFDFSTLDIHQRFVYCDCSARLGLIVDDLPIECPACHAPTAGCPRCDGDLESYNGTRRSTAVRVHRCTRCKWKKTVGTLSYLGAEERITFDDDVTYSLELALAHRYRSLRFCFIGIDYWMGTAKAYSEIWQTWPGALKAVRKMDDGRTVKVKRVAPGDWLFEIVDGQGNVTYGDEQNLPAVMLSLGFIHDVSPNRGWKSA